MPPVASLGRSCDEHGDQCGCRTRCCQKYSYILAWMGVEHGCSREAEGDRLLAWCQKLGRSRNAHLADWEQVDMWSEMARLIRHIRGMSLCCRLGEMCPYSHKALCELHLSCKLGGMFGGHRGTKAQAYKSAASMAPLATSAGDRVVCSADRWGGPALGYCSIPHQVCSACLRSHRHFFHWALSLGGCHSHTGGFHPTEQWWREGSALLVPLQWALQRRYSSRKWDWASFSSHILIWVSAECIL